MYTEEFLNRILVDVPLQAEILNQANALDFPTLQSIASRHGYSINLDELNNILDADPALMAQLQALMEDADFELDEAEMALIAGGFTFPMGVKNTGD